MQRLFSLKNIFKTPIKLHDNVRLYTECVETVKSN